MSFPPFFFPMVSVGGDSLPSCTMKTRECLRDGRTKKEHGFLALGVAIPVLDFLYPHNF